MTRVEALTEALKILQEPLSEFKDTVRSLRGGRYAISRFHEHMSNFANHLKQLDDAEVIDGPQHF